MSDISNTIQELILFEVSDNEPVKAAINHAISVLIQVENLIKQKGRHNTEIAYGGLVNAAGKV